MIVLDSLYGEGPPVEWAQVHLLAEEGFYRGKGVEPGVDLVSMDLFTTGPSC